MEEESGENTQRRGVVLTGALDCLVIAVAWQLGFGTTRGEFTIPSLVMTWAIPLTGSLMLIAFAVVHPPLIPKEKFSFPLNFTFPFLWCSVAACLAAMVATGRSSIMELPELVKPALAWAEPGTILPVFGLQVLLMSLRLFFERQAQKENAPK